MSPRLFLAVPVLCLVACNESTELVSQREPVVTLTVSNLPPLGEGEGQYQLWATFFQFNKTAGIESPLHDEGFLSLGEFKIGPGQMLLTPEGKPARFRIPETENAQLLDDIILTFQPDDHEAESGMHDEPGPPIIGGKFQGDEHRAVAELRTSYLDAFGSDFSGAAGTFTITAPTSPPDSTSGIWFVRSDSTPSLIGLPALPEGWTYEGWVVEDLSPPGATASAFYSTGKFLRADSADFDGAGPGKGPGNGLNFPGQDFITGIPLKPNLVLGKYSFQITLEPSPDNSAEPFFLQILNSRRPSVPRPTAPGILYNVVAAHAPRATVTVLR
jgi:hypothetical protein